MRHCLAALALACVVASACLAAGFRHSGASFSTARSNGANAFTTGDWVAPAVTLTSPANGARLGSATPTFTGAAGTASGDLTTITLRIYSGSDTTGPLAASGSATAASGAWTLPAPSSLADGTYTAQASQADTAGNVGKSSAVTFTIDRTAPAPAVTAPSGYVGTGLPALAGTAGNATGDSTTVSVAIKQGAIIVQTVTATRTGTSWTATPSASLPDGAYTAVATQSDDLGNSGTGAASSFTVDTVAPAVTLTTPASGAAFQTRTPSIAGTAGTAPGDLNAITVKVYSGAGTGGAVVQTLSPTAAGGTWSVNTASLADGVYTAQAMQADQAGNAATSGVVTFTVDNAAPSPIVTAPSGYVATGAPTISGTAGNATGDNTSLTVEILSGASVVRSLPTTRTGTTWSVATTPALTDGSYTVRVTQADAAGNSATSVASAFTVDTTAPTAAIAAPVSGAATNATTPAISGTAGNTAGDSSTVTIKLYSGSGTGGTLLQTLTPTRAGTAWTTTAAALADGTYTAVATQADAAGNTSPVATSTFTVDTVAPSPAITAPVGYVNTGAPTLSGTAGTATGDSSTVKVEVLSGASVAWSNNAVAVSAGTWSVAASGLSDGAYTARVTQSDWAGNSSVSSSIAFTVDTASPAPTLTAPTNGSSTNVNTPAISGAAGTATGDATSVTVTIYNGNSTGGTVNQTRTSAVSGGTWSLAATTLADGVYTAQATQIDGAGHTGTTAASTFTVDTVAPASTIAAPVGYVTTATPALSGTAGNATGDSATVTVQILTGATVVQTLTPTRTTTTWTATAAALADGSYTAKVTQTDAAGNSATSSTVSFTVDTTTPAPTVTAPALGSYTSSTTPTLSGTAGTAAGDASTVTVKVYNGAGTGGTVNQTKTPAVSGGAWSVTASALAQGTYTVEVTQTDAAGHSGTGTTVTFTVDTTAPAPPTITAPSAWANSKTPTITGTAANGAGDDATVTVEILSGASVVQTLSAPRAGTTWSVVVPAALTEGATYSARARQGDAAGNTSINSAPSTFVVDTIAPAVTLAAPVTGTYTNSTTPTFSGTASAAAGDLPTVTVRIYNSGGTLVQTRTATAVAGAWSVAATALAQGTYTAQASQSDGAANTGTSTTNSFTIDTAAPTPAGVTTANVAGGTAGVFDLGDTITFTYSEAMDPATVVTGWNGTGSQAVTLNFTNGPPDSFTVTNAGNTVHLATNVALNATFLKKNWTDSAAMLTRVSATTYRITLGTSVPNSAISKNPASAGNIAWTVDAGAKDLAGNGATGTFTETDSDVDF